MNQYVDFHPITEKKEVYTRHIERLEKTIVQINKIEDIQDGNYFFSSKEEKIKKIIDQSYFLGKNLINAGYDNLTTRGTLCSFSPEVVLYGFDLSHTSNKNNVKQTFINKKSALSIEIKNLSLPKTLAKTSLKVLGNKNLSSNYKTLNDVQKDLKENYKILLKMKKILDQARVSFDALKVSELSAEFNTLSNNFTYNHGQIPKKCKFGEKITLLDAVKQSGLRHISTRTDLAMTPEFDQAYLKLYNNGQIYARHLRGIDSILN